VSSPPDLSGEEIAQLVWNLKFQLQDSRLDVACSTQLSKSICPDSRSGPRIRGRIDSNALSPRIWLGSLLPTTLWASSLAEQLLRLPPYPPFVKPLLIQKSSLPVGQSRSQARAATIRTYRASLARPAGKASIFPLTMVPLLARFGLVRAGVYSPMRRLGRRRGSTCLASAPPTTVLRMEKRHESRTLHRPVCETQP